jgi:hypothetical protein
VLAFVAKSDLADWAAAAAAAPNGGLKVYA